MLLVPFLQAILVVECMRTLLTLGPPHPRRLRTLHNTDHLSRLRQLSINSWSKWMNQFRPVMIPHPEHSTAIRAEVALWRAAFLVFSSAIFDSTVFSIARVSICFVICGEVIIVMWSLDGGWIWMMDVGGDGHTWSDLGPSAPSGYRRCRPGSHCHHSHRLCDRCCRRIAGRALGFGIEGWIRRRHIGSFHRVSCGSLLVFQCGEIAESRVRLVFRSGTNLHRHLEGVSSESLCVL